MEDVLLYMRDMLTAYAQLQRKADYQPAEPSQNAVCYTGPLLLEQFGYPYMQDAERVATVYPWLRDLHGGCHEES